MREWRLIFYKYAHPYENMAIDEAILTAYNSQVIALPTLRIYGWKPEGISIGYFQRMEDVLDSSLCRKHMIPVVRRMTGGEAIFHADEITYSITCTAADLQLPVSVKEGFKIITAFILDAYKMLGVNACFFADTQEEFPEKSSCFCFANREYFDISVRGKKIGGNAQKRIKQYVFQHGSIPLRINLDMIQLFFREHTVDLSEKIISLEAALGRTVSFSECGIALMMAFEKTFGVRLLEQELSDWEKDYAQKLIKDKYASEAWNYQGNSPEKEMVVA